MSRKASVYLSDRAESVIGPLEEGSLSGRLNAIIDRYGEIIAHARRGNARKFTAAEMDIIAAACLSWATRQEPAGMLIGGVALEVEDASLPGGDLQGQDTTALVAKINGLSPAEVMALIEAMEAS